MKRFYFLKRERLLLHISTAIKSSDVDVSVYRVLYYIVYLSIEDHLCNPNTSINDDKNYNSDDDVYLPKHKVKQKKSSKSKEIKLMNEVLVYGQNAYVYKCFYNNKECAIKICDTTKNNESDLYQHLKLLQGVYIPNRIVSGYLKTLNCFYIVCNGISRTIKKFDDYTDDEKLIALKTLHQLHEQNVLHSDLRYKNFLINNDNRGHQHNQIMVWKEENQFKKLLRYTK